MRGLAALTGIPEETGSARNLQMFEVLSDRCLEASYRLASVVLRDEVEAQDVVHDAVLTAWRKFDSLREIDRFDAWFGRIVLNLCRDRLRSRGRSRIRDAALVGQTDVHARDEIAGVVRRDAIGIAFARLDPDLQIVVALRYYRDLPLERIGELVGIPLGTVKSRLHKGMERLRVELDRAGWREELER
jgi:RNA polymerase sigma-70 factor (ECF subfamily)